MKMAEPIDIDIRYRVKRARMLHMCSYWKAVIRRAPKRDREALRSRAAKDIVGKCVWFEGIDK